MDLTLPERLYLISYDLDKRRFDAVSGPYRSHLLRAAALAELTIRGLLGAAGNGRAARAGGPEPRDPFLARVLADVPPHKPRDWTGILLREFGEAEDTVRDRLVEAGAITVERRRVLGVIPTSEVTPAHPDQVRRLREQVRHTVTGGHDPASAPIEAAALAAIALEGDVESVFTWRERRSHKRAVKALNARFDVNFPGLREAVLIAVANARSPA
ncbi:GPP34 family phosphoprotein [Nocardiopsis mangrovi]|uniref:GPP34 family phosphoprotein n=1 Tax=Nocardiopsis mangrovi TaxID=1179818 RepID=A0ABV9DUF0_9ACTN